MITSYSLLTPQWAILKRIAEEWARATKNELGPEWSSRSHLQRVIEQYWIERHEMTDAGKDPERLEAWGRRYMAERFKGIEGA